MHRFQRWASRLAKLLGLLLALALLAGAYYAWRASPRHQGLLQAPGLGAAVKIQRDAHGIPHIEAQSVSDLAFAVGFSHAQDRGWQLETQRRIGQGRLAEAFGASALETDRFLRVLGVHRVAQRQWDWLQTHGDPEARAALLAYCAGVNAGWRSQARPPEMLILGLSFEEWTPADSLAWGLMMAWDLGGNWNQELLRLRLALQLPAAPADERMQRINELMPAYPGDRLPALGNYLQLYAELGLGRPLDAKLEGLQAAAAQQGLSGGVEGAGSNNWALAASRSATGQPLLANDPHLKLQAPALWYLARLKAPGLQVAGGMLPGLPFITLGQNQRVAWAFTNTGPDTQDLYLEELKDGAPGQPAQVRTPAGWEALSERVETLRIKGGGSEQLRVRSSRHGPLISDAGPGGDLLSVRGERRFALALRWAALEGEQDPLRVSLAINRAGSVDALQQALRGWHSPQQNMLLAEKDGDIAYLAPGRVPVRRADNDLHGLLPAPGWEPRYDWQGLLPFEALPRERAPARGWLATANQKIHGADYPHHISHDWALPYRQQRIEQQLQARERHDLASLAALQADTLSLGAQPLLAAFKAARTPHRLAAALAPAVQAFDGQMKADSAAAALFWAWVRQLTHGVYADELGAPLAERVFAARALRDALHNAMQGQDARWCDDRGTPSAETCAEQAGLALGRALDELQQRLGDDPARWSWGAVHQAKAEHRPFSRVGLLRPLFEIAHPVGGDTYSVNVARVRLTPDWAGALYTDDHGPSLRALYDLGDPSRSRVMISTGQSGLPWSRQYRDLLQPWLEVKYLPLWGSAAVAELTLLP